MSSSEAHPQYCLVCGAIVKRKVDHQPRKCEACKKFFRRCCNKRGKLKCRNGDNKCVIKCSMLTGRQNCSKCRFDKCIKAGMKSKLWDHPVKIEPDSPSQNGPTPVNSTITPSSSSTFENLPQHEPEMEIQHTPKLIPLVQDPIIYDGTAVENLLRTAVEAYTTLHPLNFLPLAKFDETLQDYDAFVYCANNHAVEIAETFENYAKFIATRQGLTSEDLVLLKDKFIVAMSVFHCLPGNENTLFIGVHQAFMPYVLRIYPYLENAWALSKQLHALLAVWDPSLVECAILFGLLFFNENALLSAKLARDRRRLWMALELLHAKTRVDAPQRHQAKLFELCLLLTRRVLTAADESRRYEPMLSKWLDMVKRPDKHCCANIMMQHQ